MSQHDTVVLVHNQDLRQPVSSVMEADWMMDDFGPNSVTQPNLLQRVGKNDVSLSLIQVKHM